MSEYIYTVFGLRFGRATSKNQGMTRAEIIADNSVERQKFTDNATSSGLLQWQYARHEGIHTSISNIKCYDSSNPSFTTSERKIFFVGVSGLGDWNIFNAQGRAVGASNGTTDTDITPAAGWNTDL